jgi:hypothetical protein
MKITLKYHKTEYRYFVTYKNENYIREEYKINNDLHVIKWNYKISDEITKGILYYYNNDNGWSDDKGIMNKNNLVPEIEIDFQKQKLNENIIF